VLKLSDITSKRATAAMLISLNSNNELSDAEFVDMFMIYLHVQWTQNNSELGLLRSKGGREDGKGKGQQDGKECV
jgi:hypothetical protein